MIETEIHHRPYERVRGNGDVDEVILENLVGIVEVTEVDENGVDNQQTKADKKVETEENYVGRGGRAEGERENVHPRNRGQTVADEKKKEDWKDLGRGEVGITESGVEDDDQNNKREVPEEIPDKGGDPVDELVHTTDELEVLDFTRALLDQHDDKAGQHESKREYGCQGVNQETHPLPVRFCEKRKIR